MRRNVALHADARGVDVAVADAVELRSAQRGPRLGHGLLGNADIFMKPLPHGACIAQAASLEDFRAQLYAPLVRDTASQ